MFDDNRDGKISREELTKMMTRLGQLTSEEEITNIMNKADKDCTSLTHTHFVQSQRKIR